MKGPRETDVERRRCYDGSIEVALWEIAIQLAAANDLATLRAESWVESCPFGPADPCDNCKKLKAAIGGP